MGNAYLTTKITNRGKKSMCEFPCCFYKMTKIAQKWFFVKCELFI